MREPTYEEGVYGVKITGQELSKSANGKPQFVLRFEPYCRENPAVPAGQPGQWTDVVSEEERAYFFLSEAAAQYSIPKLRRIGFVLPEPRIELLDENTQGFLNLIGQKVQMQCSHEVYNEELRARWDVARAQTAACDRETIRSLNASFGREFSAPVSTATNVNASVPPSTPQPQPQSQTPTRPPLAVHPDPIPDGSPGPEKNPSPESPPVNGKGAEDLPF